ncbi:phage tail tape measure protein [Orrella dioscoreae]|uniref:phage tail tape measure protein n=1 Tax=Orrella dioscoreae TaxID=1851544 RepID=UPI00082A5440|nr:phage tail tape measure protein [Orrella dioscoreae]
MDKALQLRVLAALRDKLSGPLTKIGRSGTASAKDINALRNNLKALEATQRQAQGFPTLARNLAESRSNLTATQARVAQLARELKATENPTRKLRQEYDTAVRAAGRLKTSTQQPAVELQRVRNSLTAAGVSTSNLGRHERQLRDRITQTNAALTKQTERLRAAAAAQQRLATAKDKYERTRSAAGAMAGGGAGALAMGGAGIYLGARFMAPGLDFDASMSRVQALARLDKDSPQQQALRTQARELGASTQYTAGEAADAQGFFAMAGFSPDAILASMPGLLSLAKAGGTELARTADISSNILTGFGLQADQMGRISDVMVAVFTRSNTTMDGLGDTMKYVAPVAAGLGQDLETVSAMAGKLGDAGIQGSMGGTALRAVISRLAAPPKMAADALRKLGIRTKDAKGQLRDLPAILEELDKKTAKMGNAKRAGFFKAIAGEEAFSALQVLVGQAGSGELQKLIGTLRQAQGEAGKTAGVMADNLKGDLDEMKSAWEDLGIGIQEGEDGALRGLVRDITGVINSIAKWTRENPALTSAIVRVAAAVAVVMAAMGGLTLALATLIGPFAVVRYGMTLFGARMPLVAKAFGLLTAPIRFLGTLIKWVGRLFLMNPIGLAVTAIGLAAFAIYTYWEPITEFFTGLWDRVKEAFSGGITNIGALLEEWHPLALVYKAITAGLAALGIEMPAKFSEFGGMLVQGLIGGITSMGTAIQETISTLGSNVVGWFKEKLGIRSPSRVMMEMGGYVSEGTALGIKNQQPAAIKAAQALATSVALGATPLAVADGPMGALPAMSGVDTTLYSAAPESRFDMRPPMAAPTSSPTITVQGDNITININVTQGDPQAIARAVADALRQRDAEKSARVRSSLRDYD